MRLETRLGSRQPCPERLCVFVTSTFPLLDGKCLSVVHGKPLCVENRKSAAALTTQTPLPLTVSTYSLWAHLISFLFGMPKMIIYTYIPTGYPGNDIPDGDVMTAVIHLHGNCFDLPNSVPFPYTESLNIHCSLGCLWFL